MQLGFVELVWDWWTSFCSLGSTLAKIQAEVECLSDKLMTWNWDGFEHVDRRKEKALEEIQKWDRKEEEGGC